MKIDSSASFEGKEEVPRRRSTLIHWSTESSNTFGYPDDRVTELLLKTKTSLDTALQSIASDGWNPGISQLTRESFERWFDLNTKALDIWIPKGALVLAEEARRFVEIARRIDTCNDTKNLSLGEKLRKFLEECGGEDYFNEVHTVLSCAGCLHYIAQLIYAGYHKKEVS